MKHTFAGADANYGYLELMLGLLKRNPPARRRPGRGADRLRYPAAVSASVSSTRRSAATRSSSARSAWRSTARGTIIWMRIV